MSMMAMAVATNTKTELSVSSNTDNGRKAFIQADSALRMSVLLARIMLFPSSGNLDDFLPSAGGDLSVEVNQDEFDLALLRWNMDVNKTRNRYLKAGGRSAGISLLGGGGDTGTPLIIFRKKDPSDSSISRVVAASAVSLDYAENTLVGTSLGQTSYAQQSSGKRTIFVITTDGRVPTGADLSASEDSAFYDGSSDTTHTILTTAFQEVQ
jgi:hypothetical protein